MSLYDDEDIGGPSTVSSWSRGAQLMQSQMQLKKAVKVAQTSNNANTSGTFGPLNNSGLPFNGSHKSKPGLPVLAPVIDLKSKSANSASGNTPDSFYPNKRGSKRDRTRAKVSDFTGGLLPLNDPNWTAQNEYDPLWPNDYHKIVAEMRESKRNVDAEDHHGKRRYLESGRDKIRDRYNRDDKADRPSNNERETSGFGRKPRGEDDYSDEEDSDGRRGARGSRRSTGCKIFFSGPGVLLINTYPIVVRLLSCNLFMTCLIIFRLCRIFVYSGGRSSHCPATFSYRNHRTYLRTR